MIAILIILNLIIKIHLFILYQYYYLRLVIFELLKR